MRVTKKTIVSFLNKFAFTKQAFLHKLYKDQIEFYLKSVNKNANLIQSTYKDYRKRMVKYDKKSQKRGNLEKYVNDRTLLGDKISKIKKRYFYKIDNHAFDIRELSKCDRHPYTNITLDKSIKRQIYRITNNLDKKGVTLQIENNIPENMSYTSDVTTVFSLLNDHNIYADITIFNNFTDRDRYFFISFLNKYEIISDVINAYQISILRNLYYDLDTESDSSENTNENTNEDKNNKISNFKYYVVTLLRIMLKYNDDHSDTRALIIGGAIRSDIVQAFYSGEYMVEHENIYDDEAIVIN